MDEEPDDLRVRDLVRCPRSDDDGVVAAGAAPEARRGEAGRGAATARGGSGESEESPRLFVERAIVMFRGASELVARDLFLAFAGVTDAGLERDLKSAADLARRAIDEYTAELETVVLPKASGAYATGAANVEARYRAEELIELPAATLLAVGGRELAKGQADFRVTAARIESAAASGQRCGAACWRTIHGAASWWPRRRRSVDELFAFIRARRLIDLPASERVIVAAAPVFDLGLASMHSSPPLEKQPVKSFYYITDAQAEWPVERQDAWLQKFNYPTLERHFGARSRARPLRPQPVHASHARQGPSDLDRPQPVPAALVRTGRLGALCRAAGHRGRLQGRRPPLSSRSDQ